ncbi:MAG: hypothetical protein ACRESP_02875 [Pseudomonas sp.]
MLSFVIAELVVFLSASGISLIACMLYNWRERELAIAPAPVTPPPQPLLPKRSVRREPETVVRHGDRLGLLRVARELIGQLAEDPGVWMDAGLTAADWLAEHGRPDVDHNDLLKAAYQLLLSIEIGHKMLPSIEQQLATEISHWLTWYLGSEERR